MFAVHVSLRARFARNLVAVVFVVDLGHGFKCEAFPEFRVSVNFFLNLNQRFIQ
jgi:hypothetical protein